MSGIDAAQEALIREFRELGGGFEQYAYLIEIAALLPPMEEEKKTAGRLVKGCQSNVWLDMRARDGLFYAGADSDTYIVKGVLYLLKELLDGRPLPEVAAAEIRFMEETEISATFGPDRQKGIGYVIRAMQRLAGERAICPAAAFFFRRT
ncbi:MAG: SufE family protein [Oscillospiraceae bacterium]|nr:SufE family protein [Oscillospiraceae bacterium]